jgi:hypothetical protein
MRVMAEGSTTAFVRFVATGRVETFVFAHALRRALAGMDVDPDYVHYKRVSARTGYLNEVSVSARLDVGTWGSIAAWSRRHFRGLHVDEVITGQLAKLAQFGATGEEPYERSVA